MMNMLGFGCMRLPLLDVDDQSTIDYVAFSAMVDLFLEQGGTYFDTAYMYHSHTSEIAVRECLVKRHPRDSFTVASKLPTMFLKERGDQERIFAEQLEKVGVDYFDYYLLHNLTVSHYRNVVKYDSFAFIRRMKAKGKVRQIGFSFHDSADLLDQILSEHPEVDFVQLQINYIDWNNAGIQSGACYEVARKHKVPIVVMEPVKGGMLADLPPRAAQLLSRFDRTASQASWAVRYAAGLEGVMVVLSGMSNMDQLTDNLSYMIDFTPLDEKQQQVIMDVVSILNEQIAVACTACRYCVDECPEHIAIPEYFALLNSKRISGAEKNSIHNVYYGNIVDSGRGKASACIECGACEAACPQHIEIIHHLKEVSAVLEN
ncbi:MAG: aldo/keto reductase [Sphaerochaetaceae bacterium]|nr:aldo/keto reductase [Sphaerochaetaceae bacterium]